MKRTRPAGVKPKVTEAPVRTVLAPINAPFPGCCKPFPDATFVNQDLVKLYAHHKGPRCRGYLEPMSIKEWNAEVDRREAVAAGGPDRGDVR